jgi:hypothetical protein
MMVNGKELKAILPSIGIAYVLPSVAMFAVPGLINRQWINGVLFQPFPLYAFAVQRLLKKAVTDPGEKVKEEEVEKATEEDLHSLRLIYGISAALSGSVYLYLWTTSPFLLNEIFFFNVSNPTAPITMLKGAAKVLRYDQICAFGASAVWTLLHFWDLKREGLISGVGWGRILGVFAGMSVVGGPGAAMCGMWGWREEVLNGRN